MARDPLKTAGALYFLAVSQFFLFFTVSESLYPGYSVSSNPISDLGATCTAGTCIIFQPSSTIFNSSVFVLGALSFLGAFFIYISRSRLVGGLTALAGWGAMGVGIFPETTGVIHVIVSLITFLFAAIAAIVSFRIVGRPMYYFNAALGALALVALVLYGSGTYLGLGQGGMERMVAYPDLIWILGLGAYLMAKKDEPPPFPSLRSGGE